jgi:two-component system chemotaxis response regulator CheB
MPAAVGVVLHRGERPGELAAVLARGSSLPIVEPRETQPLRQGTIYLAPADHHMMFHGETSRCCGSKEHHTRPTINPLFRSAAASYGGACRRIVTLGVGVRMASVA